MLGPLSPDSSFARSALRLLICRFPRVFSEFILYLEDLIKADDQGREVEAQVERDMKGVQTASR